MASKKSVGPTSQSVKSDSAAKRTLSFGVLKKWNFIFAGLHAVQGLAILVLSVHKLFPVSVSYTTKDPVGSISSGHTVLVSASRHVFDLNLAYLVATFFFVAAIAHLILATIYRVQYETALRKGVNRLRWIEYAVSSSIMLAGIGLLIGIQDAPTLLLLFGLALIMSSCGLAMEIYNQGKQNPGWLSYYIGCFAAALPWLAMAIYLIAASMYGAAAPGFVYWIFASIFVLFVGFAVNMYLQYRKIKGWKDYIYSERVYMILGLIAKSVLAWQIFAGSLRP